MKDTGMVRRARSDDCEAIARIYNEAITERRGDFRDPTMLGR